MKISKGIKFQTGHMEMTTVFVEISEEEIGLQPATSVEGLYANYQALSYHAEALRILEEVKAGKVHPNQIAERLKPYVGSGMAVDVKPLT